MDRQIGISTSDDTGWLSLLIARGKRSILSQRRPSRACVDDRSGTISGSLHGAVADLGAEEVHVSTPDDGHGPVHDAGTIFSLSRRVLRLLQPLLRPEVDVPAIGVASVKAASWSDGSVRVSFEGGQ